MTRKHIVTVDVVNYIKFSGLKPGQQIKK